MKEQVGRIKERLAAQGKQLNPPLTEEEIAAFEVRHGVELPPGYREFLREVGRGGDGPPEYGLAGPGEAASDMDAGQKQNWTKLSNLHKPFPFTKVWLWEEEDESEEGDEEQVEYGTLYLGNDGCGLFWLLVVTGPERGNVWQLSEFGVTPTVPSRDFLTWYEDWLDGVEDWFE